MTTQKVKFRHLLAWDIMMGSYDYWKREGQRLAEEDSAPIDVVYRKDVEGKRVWTRFADVSNEDTRARIERILETIP